MVIALSALVLFALIGFTAENSYACKVCWSDGSCNYITGSCSNVCAGSNGFPTCTNVAAEMYRPATDYILFINGQATVITGDVKIPVASDKLDNLIKELQSKYPAGKREGKEVQIEIQAEYDKFFKNSDDGKVSKSRVELIAKETGLRILDNAPTTGTITLRYPRFDSVIDADSKQPITFEWTSTGVKGPYTLKLFEVKKGQTPEQAMKNNKPVFLKEGITATFEKVPYFSISQPGVKIMCVVSCGDVVSPYTTVNSSRSNIKR